jgi:hypothetical protein
MSWRSTQLGEQFCDQDKLILSLFPDTAVNYVGNDAEFQQRLSYNVDSKNLILILNTPIWVSGIIASCKQHLTKQVETFYIGINRYYVQGNDTNKILLILGLILLLFFIMHNVKVETNTPTTTTKTVINRMPHVAVTPHYNSYKAKYYN